MAVGTDHIRNIAVAGHGTTGKTSFVEHLLFTGGVIQKPETVESGRTVSDYSEEEVENKISIHTTLSHLMWHDRKINLLDTPGSGDFAGEVVAAFRAAETGVLLVDAKAGVEIETIKLWRRLNDRNMPRVVFVNKMDEEQADFQAALTDLSEKFSVTFVPVAFPIGSGEEFQGIVNLMDMKAYTAPGSGGGKESATAIPEDVQDQVNEAREQLVESAAEGDDELLTKFLEEETLTEEEIRRGLTEGLQNNKIVPVLCGSALQNSGITTFLDILSEAAPSPQGVRETAVDAEDNETEVPVSTDGQFSGFCFKTSIDQFSGKLSFVKAITGTLDAETELYNAREGKKERTPKIYTSVGKKLEEMNALSAGDIGVLTKVTSARTNDTFCTPENTNLQYKPLDLPQPVHSVAISVHERRDEDKLADVLHKTVEEDLTFRVNFNEETKETVISGMGELHLNIILKKIHEQQKIDVETKVPKVAYRETITKSADATYRHKKQSGGHGQFGEVVIHIDPIERGEYYTFKNMIRGMAISKSFIPGIEKGLIEAMQEGIIAGYPMVDIGVQLLDGKEHPVDSSEMAFKAAAKGAMKDAMSKGSPTLLEPVMDLEVFIEDQYLGDVLSDLTSRRGRVQGQESLGGGIMEIKAQVPQSELLRYSIDLRSITSGTGSFGMEFSHYSPISGKIADEVIRQAKEASAVEQS
jgi:elongation factor G